MKLLDWDHSDRHSNEFENIRNYISSVDFGNSPSFPLSEYSSTLSERITSSGRVYIRQILTYDYPDYIGDAFKCLNLERREEIYGELNKIYTPEKKLVG